MKSIGCNTDVKELLWPLNSSMMKIAYIGNFHNYGNSLSTAGTALVYLMSELKEVESVDVFCASPNNKMEETFVPDKVRIIPTFCPSKPFSILNLYAIRWKNYDRVIFNILPTVFGKSVFMNMLGLISPYVLTKFGNKNIRVVYHNSTFTNDVERLGYDSQIDSIKKAILSIVEMRMFTSLQVYMPLKMYVEKILIRNSKAFVKSVDMRFIEAIPTIYINGLSKSKFVERCNGSSLTILLHGYWGPQKNLELALKTLFDLKNEGIEFHLILSGSINEKFPDYKDEFNELVEKYLGTNDEILGHIPEKDILKLFLRSDLVVIPYNTPGGHSGVLETAIAFGNSVLCIRYPEYEEQSAGFDDIILTDPDNFYEHLKMYLKENILYNRKASVSISEKINHAVDSMRQLLK